MRNAGSGDPGAPHHDRSVVDAAGLRDDAGVGDLGAPVHGQQVDAAEVRDAGVGGTRGNSS